MSNLTKIVGLNILQSSQIIDLQAVTVGFTLLQSSQIIGLQAVRFLICSRFCKNPAKVGQIGRGYDL